MSMCWEEVKDRCIDRE